MPLTPKMPLSPWEWPDLPWSRIYNGFAVSFIVKMFLAVVNTDSKWIEVSIAPSATSNSTFEKLKHLSAKNGLPEIIVSDNGTAFTSTEFHETEWYSTYQNCSIPSIFFTPS